MLAQSVLFAAIFYGIAAIWERDLGVLHRYMVGPASRSALVLGKAISSGPRGLSQAVVIYLLALLLALSRAESAQYPRRCGADRGRISAVFDLLPDPCLHCEDPRQIHGIGQVLTMPIFFASNAIYPLDIMPGGLKGISLANPLTYEVDGLRALMLNGGTSAYGLATDCLVLTAITAVSVAIAARMHPHLTT